MGGRRRTSSLPSSSTRPGTTSYGGSHGALAQTVARADWNEVARDWRAGTRWPGGRIQLDAAVASSNMAGHRIPHHPHPQRGTISSSLELRGENAGQPVTSAAPAGPSPLVYRGDRMLAETREIKRKRADRLQGRVRSYTNQLSDTG